MAITRIKNNQITDLTVNAAAKLQDYSVTSGKIANNLTYGSDLTVTGNLTVQGNVTAIDTIDLVVEDPLILLAKDQTGTPTLDIGFIGKRGTEDNIAFIWDESADEFAAVFTSSEITNTTVSINSYASVHVNDITAANADITGNVTFSGNIVGDLGVTGNITGANLNSNAAVTGVTITASGNLEGGNAVITGDVSTATVSASGNVLAGNVNSNAAVTGVTITASGNLEGGNAVITGDVSAATGSYSGNVVAANLNANSGVTASTVDATTITASGNLVGGNANITNGVYAATGDFTGNVSAGNISTSGELAVATISATGNITGGNLISNADVTTVTVTASGNVDAGNLNSSAAVTGVTITASGNLEGGNAVITGDVSAATGSYTGNVDVANINATTNVTGTTITASGNLEGNNAVITNDISSSTVTASGNIDGANVNASSGVYASTVDASGNIAGSNVNIVNGVYAATGDFTGNVTAAYFIGDGSQLTGIDVTRIENGNSNVKIAEANGNIAVSVTGISNTVVFTPTSVEVTGEVNVSGNVLSGNVNANGAVTAASATVTGNVDSGNINATGGVYSATGDFTGNITAGNIQSNAEITGVTVTATGNLVGGNANITAGVFAADVTATGNVNGGNVNTDSIVGSEIVVTAGNVSFALTGNISMAQRWINNLADPTQAYDAATKQYVDDAVSSGIQIHPPVYVESPNSAGSLNATYAQGGTTHTVTDITGNTVVKFSANHGLSVNDLIYWGSSFNGITANVGYLVFSTPNLDEITLSATYNGSQITNLTDGTSLSQVGRANPGSGATLTNAGTLATLVIDGETLTGGERVLIYNQTNGYENGVYDVTVPGDVGNAWVLTRSSDMDTYIPNSITGVDAGDYFFVQAGDTGAGESYVMTAPTGVIIIGYNPLTFTQFSSSSIYSAGNGLSLNGTVFSVNVDNDTTAIVADTVVVKVGANLVTPNIGDATGNSLTLSGNGLLSATTVTATGNVSGSNVNATNGVYTATVNASGNVLAGNVNSNAAVTGVTITASGNLEGGNAVITGDVSAATGSYTGNVDAANLNATTNVTGTTITASGNLVGGNANITNGVYASTGDFTGNVTAGNISTTGELSVATISATGNITGGNLISNADVTTVTVTASGNIDGANINASSGVTASTVDATTITASGNLVGGNANITNGVYTATVDASGNIVAGNLNSNAAVTGVTITASGNLEGGNAVITGDVSGATGTFTGNIDAGNLTTLGNVEGAGGLFTGNVTAQNFIGNIIGNIDAGGANTEIQFNDGDLLAGSPGFTFDKTSNLVTVSGNVSAANLVSTGDVTTVTVTASGNISGANVNTSGSVKASEVDVSGNVIANNASFNNEVFTEFLTANTAVVSPNITSFAGLSITSGSNGNIQLGPNGTGLIILEDETANRMLFTGANKEIDTTANATFDGANLVITGSLQVDNVIVNGSDITSNTSELTINVDGADVNFRVAGDNQNNLFIVDAGSDTVLIGTDTPTTNVALKIGTTNSIVVPVGTSLERPNVPVTGMVRFNTTLDALEFYDSTQWTIAGAEFTIIQADSFIGDGSTLAFTLSADSTTASTLVSINGVLQIPVTAYSVSGTTLTFTEAPESTDVIDARILTTTTEVTGISNASGNAAVQTPVGNDVEITGNLIPTANVTYNLGAPDAAWDALYVAGNTIYLGELQLKDIGSNTFAVFTSDGVTQANLDVGAIDVSQLNSGTSTIGISGPNGNAFVTVGGTANVLVVTSTGANIAGTLNATGDITGGNLSVSTGNITTGNIVNANANGVGNIGSSTTYFNTVFAKATSAQYADLAEMYEADSPVEPGTVVCFGGAKEVTVCDIDSSRKVAGVVSTNPSYLMNSGQTGDYVVAVALQGRVPVKVTGRIRKGDMMVAAGDGRARAEENPQVGSVIGKALADFDGADGVIEVVIGRL